MKFNDIAIGTAFEFEGVEYVKTDALLATSSTGTKRLIRRSAILKPVGGAVPLSEDIKPDMVDRQLVLDAFERFYAECRTITGDHPQLSLAYRKFLAALK